MDVHIYHERLVPESVKHGFTNICANESVRPDAGLLAGFFQFLWRVHDRFRRKYKSPKKGAPQMELDGQDDERYPQCMPRPFLALMSLKRSTLSWGEQ
jgi:hypothetical protein